MKILVLNSSPKGEHSNSLKLTRAFLEGFTSVREAETETVELSKLDLHPCRGCFACWNKTPGKCVIGDDMAGLLEKILRAGLIVYSFPLYCFSLPAQLKTVIDRMLPLSLPFMESDTEAACPPASVSDSMNGRDSGSIRSITFLSWAGRPKQ